MEASPQLLNSQPSRGIPVVPRVGRIVQVPVVVSATGVVTPINILTTSNAFYVFDSPVPLIIRTGISGQQAYPVQTGESFPQQLMQVIVQGVVGGAVSITYNVKIWVGPDSHVGFIDHRSMQVPSSITRLAGPNNTINTASCAPGTFTAFAILQATTGNFISGLMVSNLDSANLVYLSHNAIALFADINGLTPVFPQQVYQLPLTQSVDPNNGGSVYFWNPSAAAVIVAVSPLYTSTGYSLESTP